MVPQPYYHLRQATALDAPILLSMHEMGKARSDIWVSLPAKQLEGAIMWGVNAHEPPFTDLAEDIAPPFWVLEKSELTDSILTIVGAVQLGTLLNPKEPRPMARVVRLLWDEKTDASIVISEIVARMVPAANEVLKAAAENIGKIDQPSQLPYTGTENGGTGNVPSLNTNLGYIEWRVAEGNPLKPWLLANRLAEETLDPPYEIANDWSVEIIGWVMQ